MFRQAQHDSLLGCCHSEPVEECTINYQINYGYPVQWRVDLGFPPTGGG